MSCIKATSSLRHFYIVPEHSSRQYKLFELILHFTCNFSNLDKCTKKCNEIWAHGISHAKSDEKIIQTLSEDIKNIVDIFLVSFYDMKQREQSLISTCNLGERDCNYSTGYSEISGMYYRK